MAMRGAWWACAWLLVVSCKSGGLELFVDLKTDLVAAVEFHEVTVLVEDTATFQETAVRPGEAFAEGQRVAEFAGLSSNPARVVRVVLRDDEGRTVAERQVVVRHTESRGVTVLITRDCRDARCADDQTCYGGRCVDPACVTGAEPSCPPPECAAAGDCAAMSACASARCEASVCVYFSSGSCGASEYCDPAVGCRPRPTMSDAGPEDAGGPDVGGTDAGSSDAGTGPPAPAPHWPPNGHPTGSVHAPPSFDVLRPTFRWRAVSGASDYQLQVTAECSAGGFDGCPFDSPVIDTRTAELTYQPAAPLEVATAPPVGRRYFWRVRSCGSAGCGAWSRVRYVDVGRLSFDANGDGYDDVVVGGRHGGMIYLGGSGGVEVGGAVLVHPLTDTTSSYGSPISFGDVNADGYRDVLIGAESDRGFGSVVLHRGGPTGLDGGQVFTNPPASEANQFFGREAVLADVDADGYADLVAGNVDETWWYRGGPAVADTPTPIGRRRLAQGVADVDADGYADLLGEVVAYGGPSGPTIRSGDRVTARYALGDLDGDGWVEFVAGLNSTNASLATTAGGTFSMMGRLGAGMLAIDHQVGAVIDVDGDGDGDVWSSWPGTGSGEEGTVWYVAFEGRNPRVAQIASPCSGACRNGWALTAGADYNGDGLGDAAAGYPSQGGVALYFGRLATGAAPVPQLRTSGAVESLGLGL